MEGQNLKAELRLQAVEYVLNQLNVAFFQNLQIPTVLVEKLHQQVLATLSEQAMPGLPAELSDHAVAELHDAVERLLKRQRLMLASVRGETYVP